MGVSQTFLWVMAPAKSWHYLFILFGAKTLCGQVCSLLKHNYFSDVELNRLELQTSSLLPSSDETGSDSETSSGGNGEELECPRPLTDDNLLQDGDNLTLPLDSSILCVPDTEF